MRIADHLTCLLRNLYAGQEATVRTGHGTMDWFQIRKGICQGCILSPCLFNLYAEFNSVQSLSRVWLFVTPWITAHQASLSITNSRSSPKLMCIESVMPSVMPSSCLILCHPLILLPPIPPSSILLVWTLANLSFSIGSKKQQLDPDKGLVQNWERSMTRLYIVMLLI